MLGDNISLKRQRMEGGGSDDPIPINARTKPIMEACKVVPIQTQERGNCCFEHGFEALNVTVYNDNSYELIVPR